MTLPQVYVDVGFTTTGTDGVFTVGDPVLGQVGSVPIGSDTIWTDVSQYVRSWSIKRGAGRGDSPTLRFDPGTCTIEFNDGDRRFDPDNLAGPYVVGGVTQVEPRRRVRIRAVYNGITYPIFYGYADDWRPTYIANSWTYTTLTATDASVLFASNDRGASVSGGAGEDSGARVVRILNAYGWPAGNRSIAIGDTTLQATTLEGNMLSELQLVQDSEQGQFFISPAGVPTFRNRRSMLELTPATTSQATFGDGGFLATGEIPYSDVIPSTPADTLINYISATRVGGAEQVAQDAPSVARYGPQTHSRSDLIVQDDATALQWANWIKYQYATPYRRFARMEFNTPAPHVEAAFWPAMLGRDFFHRITVIRRPPGGGSAIQHDCFVLGMEHFSDGAVWTSAFVLQSADRFSFFTVGDPILGRVGSNAVAY